MPKKIKLLFFGPMLKKFGYRFAQSDFILIKSLFLGIRQANFNHFFNNYRKTLESAEKQNTFLLEPFDSPKNDIS